MDTPPGCCSACAPTPPPSCWEDWWGCCRASPRSPPARRWPSSSTASRARCSRWATVPSTGLRARSRSGPSRPSAPPTSRCSSAASSAPSRCWPWSSAPSAPSGPRLALVAFLGLSAVAGAAALTDRSATAGPLLRLLPVLALVVVGAPGAGRAAGPSRRPVTTGDGALARVAGRSGEATTTGAGPVPADRRQFLLASVGVVALAAVGRCRLPGLRRPDRRGRPRRDHAARRRQQGAAGAAAAPSSASRASRPT